jgi:hypothetical protein
MEPMMEKMKIDKDHELIVVPVDPNSFKDSLDLVKADGMKLKDVQNQTDKICLAAVEENGLALQYVNNQSGAIQKAALKQNKESAKFVV